MPAASVATAVSACVPFATVAVFHDTLDGGVVSGAPMLLPSTRNWTFAMPLVSEALPFTMMVPGVPPGGLSTDTVGGVLSTVTDTGADVAGFPAASVALAVNRCDPLPLLLVIHDAVNGADVSAAPSATPSTRNCTLATVPELSLAVAAIVTVPETSAPATGLVTATVGGVVIRRRRAADRRVHVGGDVCRGERAVTRARRRFDRRTTRPRRYCRRCSTGCRSR